MKQLQHKLTTPPQLLVTEGATDDQEETQVGGIENYLPLATVEVLSDQAWCGWNL